MKLYRGYGACAYSIHRCAETDSEKFLLDLPFVHVIKAL